jgi:hypothetical protein
MGRAVRPILDAIGIPHEIVESSESTANSVARIGASAFGTRMCSACLLPRRLTVPAQAVGLP